MKELYKNGDGVSVFDLDVSDDGMPLNYVKSSSEQKFLSDVSEFTNAGFRIASKERFPTENGPGRKLDYDKHSPEAILVSNGQDPSSVLKHGMLFLHSGLSDDKGAFLFMALDERAKGNFFEDSGLPVHQIKGNSDGVFFDIGNDKSFGYIRLDRNLDAAPGREFEEALQHLRELDLPTIPIPLNRDVAQMIPHFGKEGMDPEELSMDEIARVLGENFQGAVNVFDMPENLMKIANAANPLFKPDEANIDYHLDRKSHLNPSIRR